MNSEKRRTVIGLLVELWLAVCVLTMSFIVEFPWIGRAGLLLLLPGLIMVRNHAPGGQANPGWRELVFAWISSLVVWGALLPGRSSDGYYAWLAWLVAASVFFAGWRLADPPTRQRWQALAAAWAFGGNLIWLAAAWSQNEPARFWLGWVLVLALLILCRIWFRLPAFWVQFVNTLLLLLVAVPVADHVLRPAYRLDARPETGRKFYSYAAAAKNPTAFARWWDFYLQQWNQMATEVFCPDPDGVLPFRLRPGSRGKLFESSIEINRRGFRGPEIPDVKGNTYRIVALGESTTYGCTLAATDQTWPELLEAMIRERIKPNRPVEVINAGVPAYSLDDNLHRWTKDILPLEPDLVISYHGFNGFKLLAAGMERSQPRLPPAYRERPLKLLADCEYRLKMIRYQRNEARLPVVAARANVPLMETKCAQDYEQLIGLAETNHIRLALANFSMAVNDRSGTEVVEFYRSRYPSIYWQIKANAAHSLLLQNLGRQHAGVTLINTQPHLDAEHDKFIDLVHLTQAGRQQLAESIFAGISNVLTGDLKLPAESRTNPPKPAE